MPGSPGQGQQIFISYARKDDEAFVHRLYGDLKERGLPVWWDRAAMESRGQAFLQVIRDAIVADCARLLLVVGREAISSDYVRYEWRQALESCKVVVPILRGGDAASLPAELKDAAFNLTPRELALLHVVDFRQDDRYQTSLAELVRILTQELLPPGKFKGLAWSPPHFLPRPEYLKQLERSVLADVTAPVVITSTLTTTALQGMGGVGKSVLAAAFGQACFTRRTFTGGVIWLPFGRQDENRLDLAVENLRRLGAALGRGDIVAADVETAAGLLGECLAEKTCLLILDDVWEQAHVWPFVSAVRGTRSRVLITTRNGGFAGALGAVQCSVGVLAEDAALLLLARSSRTPLGELPRAATEIARECGYLPLALAMVGAMVADKSPDRWQDALASLKEADLQRIRYTFPDYADKPNLYVAMQVSVDALTPALRQRYLDFAVFAEDERVPGDVLVTFWKPLGLSGRHARETIDALVDRSLLGRDADGLLSLHDIQHDFISREVSNLQELRARFLESYRQCCGSGDWPSGPNDGYFFQHLVEHLIAADREEQVHRLLAISAESGGNAWYAATENAGLWSSYVNDLERATNLASRAAGRELAASGRAASVGRQIRYGLMRSSLAAVGRNLPIAVSLALYRQGVESAGRLLDRARSLPEQDAPQFYRKLETLWTLGECFPEPDRTRAFEIALSLAEAALASSRLVADRIMNPLAQVLARVPGPLLDRAAALVRGFPDVNRRDELGIFLAARYLEVDDAEQAFAVMAAIEDPARRGRALERAAAAARLEHVERFTQLAADLEPYYQTLAGSALGVRLAILGLQSDAIRLLQTLPATDHISEALCAMAGCFDEHHARQALTLAKGVPEYSAASALAVLRLAQRLPPPENSLETTEVWNTAKRRWDKRGGAARLSLLRELPIELVRADAAWLEFDHELRLAYAARLAALGFPDEAIELATDDNDHERARGVQAIVKHVVPSHMLRLVDLAASIGDRHEREVTLSDVLPRLASFGLGNAVERALEITDPYWRARALEGMAPHLDASGLRLAARVLSGANDESERRRLREVLAAFAPDELPEDFASALRAGLPLEQTEAILEHLASRHPGRLDEALAAIRLIEDEGNRREALLAFAAHAAQHDLDPVVREAFEGPWEDGQLLDNMDRVSALVPRLSPSLGSLVRAATEDRLWPGLRQALDPINPSAQRWAGALAGLGHADRVWAMLREKRAGADTATFSIRAGIQPFLSAPERQRVLSDLIAEVEASDNPYIPVVDIEGVERLSPALTLVMVKHLRTRCEADKAVTATVTLARRLAELGDAQGALALVAELRSHSPEYYLQVLYVVADSDDRRAGELLPEAVRLIVRVTNPVNNPSHRARSLSPLARLLNRRSKADLLPLWTRLIEGLSRYPRREFLLDLAALTPVIVGLSGSSALVEIRKDVERVAGWWP